MTDAHGHLGGDFDDFLAEDGMLEAAAAAAAKRVFAWQLAQAMQRGGVTQSALAQRMQTSRAVVRRLLDETDTGVTLATLARASVAVGAGLRLELGAAGAQ